MSLKRGEISRIKSEKPDSPIPETEEEIAALDNEEGIEDDDEEFTPKKRKRIKRESVGYRHPRRFNPRWMSVPEVKSWVYGLRNEPAYVWCKYCKKKIRAHLTDMKVHNKTAKHQKNLLSTRPEIPASTDMTTDFIHDGDSKRFMASDQSNILITFPSQRDTSQEVIVVPVHQDGAISPTPSSKELIIPASIGFIGCGNMAQSLMNAFFAKGLVEPHLMMASAPSHRNLSKVPHGMRTTNDNNQVVRECDIIFICVKPHMLPEMIEGLDPLERDHNPLFVSVVTGFDLNTLEQMLGSLVDSPRVIRIMPNTPCMIGQGCCVYTMGSNTNDSDNKVIHSMLHSVGYCAKIPEYQMDAACGLAGSGPAYIYAAIEALADGGVKMGLPRALSQSLAAHVVKGAASMVLETGKHPAQLKDEVCSPAGTTITAMHSLEKNGFRNALISAVEASASRSKELGEKH